MKALFCHDCRFLEKDNNIYTEGGFDNKLFDRYLKHFDTVTVVARLDNINSNNIANICEENLVDNITFIPINFNYKNVVAVVKKAVRTYDLAIIRLPSIVGTIAVHYCKKFNKPYFVEMVGCPWDALWNYSRKGKLLAPFMYIATRNMIKNALYVLYVTNEFLQKRYPTKGKSTNCSNVELNAIDETIIHKRKGKIANAGKELVLGTAAAVDVVYKGQDLVIKAIAELNKQGHNFRYRLIGGGDKTRLLTIAEAHGIGDKIIFEGAIPHEKVFDYLDNIDIYIQPSNQEGLPRALIEAMSRGCPCIGSSTGGIPELLDKEYVFTRGNFEEIVTILANFDVEKMNKQAIRNFEVSKGYAKNVLHARRFDFLHEFAESVKER